MSSIENQSEVNNEAQEVTDKILTVPNVISIIRLCLVPVYLILLINGQNIWAVTVFAIAAITDFLDGQVARRTHSVSKLGKILDPAIDTILMVTGFIGTLIIDTVPLWIVVLVFAREAFLLIGGAILINKYDIRIAVIYPGKFATTFLFFGIAAMLLNMPLIPGLGLCDISWLPGFNYSYVCWGIWFVYLGLLMQIGVTIYYCVKAQIALKAAKRLDSLKHRDNAVSDQKVGI